MCDGYVVSWHYLHPPKISTHVYSSHNCERAPTSLRLAVHAYKDTWKKQHKENQSFASKCKLQAKPDYGSIADFARRIRFSIIELFSKQSLHKMKRAAISKKKEGKKKKLCLQSLEYVFFLTIFD